MESNVLPPREKINITELLLKDFDLNPHSSMHTRGRADYALYCKDFHDIRAALAWADEQHMPVTILGSATNCVISDRGIPGLTIITTHLTRCHINGVLFCARAGMQLDKAINLSIDAGLAGLEMLGGIPGTVGGAVFGNAGAGGTTISSHLYYVDWIDRNGELRRLEAYPEDFGNRESPFKHIDGAIIYEAGFLLHPTKQTAPLRTIKEGAMRTRRANHQFDWPSCGCFFKNPEGKTAGKLIEACGLKGKRIGGAMVSPYHANFVVNTGEATSDDLYLLGEEIRNTVRQQTGVELAYEVRFLGRPSPRITDLQGNPPSRL